MRKSDLHEEHFVFVQGAVCANPCPTGTYHLDCRFPSSSSLLTSFSSHNHQSLHIVCRNSLLCVAIDIISALHVVLKTHSENVVTVTMEHIATMSMGSAIVSQDIRGRR